MSRINLSLPPYQVPCRVCHAFAMAPCKSPKQVLAEPHDERWVTWAMYPAMRVKVTNDTYTRWEETFEQWVLRMMIHCPTARSVGELMFFAAEKIDLTTEDYLRKYFSELVPTWKEKAYWPIVTHDNSHQS
jgi:hypothetical protein